MIKFIEEKVPLTQDDKMALYKFGEDLYNKVMSQGGFIKVFSQRKLPQYLKENKLGEIYTKQIIVYEYQQIVDAQLLSKPYFFTNEDIARYNNEKSLSWLQNSVYVLTINPNSMKMIDNFFSMETLTLNHGEDIVNVMVEQSMNKKLFIIMLKKMKFKEYQQYMSNQSNFNDQKIASVSFQWSPKEQQIKYLTSFLFKSLKPQSSYDCLSYLKNQINGISTIKVQIHYEGNWKQGNLTNIGVNEIHLNHGPNNCLWVIVEKQYVNKLRSFVKEKYNIDILKDKEIWFDNPDFFLLNKIPFKYLQQEKGDVVIQNAGNLAWIKASGLLITTSWCQMVMNDETLTAMSERYVQLKELQINPEIPYQNILLDLYIHEGKLNQTTLDSIQKQLQQFFIDDNQLLKSLNLINQSTQIGIRNVSFCMKCGREIFNYYYQNDKKISCLDCLIQNKESQEQQLSSKYRYHCLHFLLQSQNNQCDQEFCSTYTGKTKCKIFKEQLLKEQEYKQKQQIKSNEYQNQIHEIQEEEQKVQTINEKTRNKTRKQTLDYNSVEPKRQRK